MRLCSLRQRRRRLLRLWPRRVRSCRTRTFSTSSPPAISAAASLLGLDQHSFKRFAFFLGYLSFHFTTDAPAKAGFTQSAYSNQGEAGAPDWEARHRLFFFGSYNLPEKITLSAQMDAQSGAPFNVTTGTDSNGDGVFNDRPSYASAAGSGVYSTPFGLLSTDTANGDVPRNLGTMPALFHLDTNLSRAFKLGKADAGRTLTLNARAANLLNHTNVAAISTVVSAPNFAQPIAAETARRIEFGVRIAF